MADEALQNALAALLPRLLGALDHLEVMTRRMHPPLIPALAATIGDDDAALEEALAAVREGAWPEEMVPYRDQIDRAGRSVLHAHAGFRTAAANPADLAGAFRAARQQYRAIEALYPLAPSLPSISRFFVEPARRDDTALAARLEAARRRPVPDTGVFHFDNDTGSRGGFSVYVPEYLDMRTNVPLVCALHGGAGHGHVFLWSWLREARARGVILVTPTATGDTWSLMEPDIDSAHLSRVLAFVSERWPVDPVKLLLTGMSDGGTFTPLSGLDADSPFTHLAPAAASFHPMLVTMAEPERIQGLPIYLVHGALDWMFPVSRARTAYEVLTRAGAKMVYREIADLSHTYPRDENGSILDWFVNPVDGV
jgi:phospholipase/carboxylesterase